KIIMGSLAKRLVGSKNQNTPTPAVKNAGSTKLRMVMSLANPSLSDQKKSPSVRTVRPPIA
ncbi:MAG: hypothetical protein AAB875_03745, partial [Patescibacteria group bacterium]